MLDRIFFREGRYNPFVYIKDRVDTVLQNYQNESYQADINNVLELHNIVKYLEVIDDANITAEEKHEYKTHIGSLKKSIGICFSKINSDNFEIFATELSFDYALSFWSIMQNHKRITSFEQPKFKDYLDKNPHHIISVLANKSICVLAADAIYLHLLDTPNDIHHIISFLFEKRDPFSEMLYITDTFTPDQLRALYEAYINCDSAHLNMLTLLKISQNDPSLGLDDEIRLMAKHREKEVGEKITKDGHVFKYAMSVAFKDTDEVKSFTYDPDGQPCIVYDNKWLNEYLDFPTVLNNFIYLFEYTDILFRSKFPIKHSRDFSLFDFFSVKGKRAYNTDGTYSMMCGLSTLQMQGYCSILQTNGVDIEDVFKWFFETYLNQEFGVDGFTYNTPSKGTSYLEKCKNIATEMEGVLKQYRLFCKYRHVDRELLEMSSEHIIFSQLRSMQERKYVYEKSDRIRSCSARLFGDATLCITDDEKYSDCKSLAEALLKHPNINLADFDARFQQEGLQQLLEYGVIAEDDGVLRFAPELAVIMKDLYENDVLVYPYCGELKCKIEELIDDGDLFIEATLFSIPEQDYLDYILNKSKFSDGLDLRNKYVHGTPSQEEATHQQDYWEFLKIMVLIIIKINEEMCLAFPSDSQSVDTDKE